MADSAAVLEHSDGKYTGMNYQAQALTYKPLKQGKNLEKYKFEFDFILLCD